MTQRSFLFLQGPHGPFFSKLAGELQQAGCDVHRIGFNAGDEYFWSQRDVYTAYTQPAENWPDFVSEFYDQHGITDIVLYGDTRYVHDVARKIAAERDIKIHCFEEGYLRPYWVTYELNGVNGNSRLMDMSLDDIKSRLVRQTKTLTDAPSQWGALWHHTYFGAVYHWHILFRNRKYRFYETHRAISVGREWWLHFHRLLNMPLASIRRRRQARRLENSGKNYHLVLMQLAHDTSFTAHSDFGHISEFIELCISSFALGAPKHHLLVFKPHPLEDGRENLPKLIRTIARQYGIADRVEFLESGKLGALLDRALTAVTVNSTAGQQALWRGMPLRTFGRSVYSKPELVSEQPLDEFFADPEYPDTVSYMAYRRYLLETSQFNGGFYTASGRAQVIRVVVEVILHDIDPYDIHPQIQVPKVVSQL